LASADDQPEGVDVSKVTKAVMWIVIVIGGLILWSISGQIGKFVGKSAVERYQSGQTEGAVEQAIEQAAIEIRKQLPMKVDKITTLQNVISAGNTLQYHYIMDVDVKTLDKNVFKINMRKSLLHNICNQKDMVFTMNLGGNYLYLYKDKNGLYIDDFKFRKNSC
jgi:hypothetical protein